ncbi:MAG: 6-bladed beta-propeller [Rhodothermia bacterium]
MNEPFSKATPGLSISTLFLAVSILFAGCQTGEFHPTGYEFEKSWGVRGEAPGALREPVGILVVGDEVFVSDAGNNRIQVYSLDGDFLRAFGSEGDGPGELGRPMHLGRSGQTLLVPEYINDRIQLFTLAGEALSTIGFSGSGPGEFDAPTSATVDSAGRIWVADFYNQRVQVLGPDGNFIRQFGITGEDGPDPGQFTYPTAVSIFPDGGFVVGDAYNHRIQTFDADGTFSWMLPDDMNWADTAAGHFNVATSVQVSPTSDIVVADFYNHRVQVISREGEFLFSFGSKGTGDGQFDRPIDAAFDGEGNLYVVDFGNDRVQKFNPVY